MHKAEVDRQHRDKACRRLGAKAATAPMTLAHWIDFFARGSGQLCCFAERNGNAGAIGFISFSQST